MKHTSGFRRLKRSRRTVAQCTQLLAAFARSGLSAAAFARQPRLHSTTFCGWRQRWAETKVAPAFVQVDLASAPMPTELVVEWGGAARRRIRDVGQLELAARLRHALHAPPPC